MTSGDALRAAVVSAHGAVFGAVILSPGFMMSESGAFGWWWLIGAIGVGSLLAMVPMKPAQKPASSGSVVFPAALFGAGLCVVVGIGAFFFRERIVWPAVETAAFALLAAICGVVALLLMFLVMDRLRKAGERRDLRSRGELP